MELANKHTRIHTENMMKDDSVSVVVETEQAKTKDANNKKTVFQVCSLFRMKNIPPSSTCFSAILLF